MNKYINKTVILYPLSVVIILFLSENFNWNWYIKHGLLWIASLLMVRSIIKTAIK